jgi:hypothetical protein
MSELFQRTLAERSMIETQATKACTNCAKARRKCGKQHPKCHRCQTRGMICNFPRSRPSCFVPLLEDTSSGAIIQALPSPVLLCFPLIDDNTASWWFAAPETWAIDAPSSQLLSTTRFISSDFDRLLHTVLSWLIEWIDKGSNSFIHHHLYQTCFPSAMQDAYTSVSTYLGRTPQNTAIVHRIIANRAALLVASGLPNPPNANSLDTLARVQALLIYQIIGISSPDITLRALASQHIPVLESWLTTLMQHTRLTLLTPSSTSLWHTWILAESARRTWLITAGIQGLYKFFTNPDPMSPCLGGTVFTSRRGFWEAQSARAWEKECCERYAGLVRLTEPEKMLEKVPREEISEFARVVLECTYGVQWCEELGIRG